LRQHLGNIEFLRKPETWYRARLRHIVAMAAATVEPPLKAWIKKNITVENQTMANHLAITARNLVQAARTKHKFTTDPETIATAAANMTLEVSDKRFVHQMQRALGVTPELPTIVLPHGAITRIVKAAVGDAARPLPVHTAYGSAERMRQLMRQRIRENVSLIESIPAQYFDEVESMIYQNIMDAARWEDLAERLVPFINERRHVAESHADLIARDQTGKIERRVHGRAADFARHHALSLADKRRRARKGIASRDGRQSSGVGRSARDRWRAGTSGGSDSVPLHGLGVV
jgi:hypothetical protein